MCGDVGSSSRPPPLRFSGLTIAQGESSRRKSKIYRFANARARVRASVHIAATAAQIRGEEGQRHDTRALDSSPLLHANISFPAPVEFGKVYGRVRFSRPEGTKGRLSQRIRRRKSRRYRDSLHSLSCDKARSLAKEKKNNVAPPVSSEDSSSSSFFSRRLPAPGTLLLSSLLRPREEM